MIKIETYGKANLFEKLFRKTIQRKKAWGICGVANNPEWDNSPEEC